MPEPQAGHGFFAGLVAKRHGNAGEAIDEFTDQRAELIGSNLFELARQHRPRVDREGRQLFAVIGGIQIGHQRRVVRPRQQHAAERVGVRRHAAADGHVHAQHLAWLLSAATSTTESRSNMPIEQLSPTSAQSA